MQKSEKSLYISKFNKKKFRKGFIHYQIFLLPIFNPYHSNVWKLNKTILNTDQQMNPVEN
jgi:hypothetical protein